MADINNYLSSCCTLFVAFGVAFETPVAVVLLVLTNLVTLQKLRKARGYVLIIVFIIAAHSDAAGCAVADRDGGADVPALRGRILFAAIMSRQQRQHADGEEHRDRGLQRRLQPLPSPPARIFGHPGRTCDAVSSPRCGSA